MACAITQSSPRHAGQVTVEVRSGSGTGGDCNLAGGNTQPHTVVITNLETFPAYVDCTGSIGYPPPTPVEFHCATHTITPTRWAAHWQRVSGAHPANSLTLNHVRLVSRFQGTPTVNTKIDAQWPGHYRSATVNVDITVTT